MVARRRERLSNAKPYQVLSAPPPPPPPDEPPELELLLDDELLEPDELDEEELLDDDELELEEELDEELPEPAGTTKSVMLCDGTVVEIAVLVTLRSLKCAIEVCEAELICQTWAVPDVEKFARLTVTGVLPCCLLITITVKAPSDVLTEAKAERLSGLVTLAATLVSPKVDLLPS